MTSSSILKLILDEQSSLAKRRNTALARGLWIKAHDCDVAIETLGNVSQRIINEEINSTGFDPASQGGGPL